MLVNTNVTILIRHTIFLVKFIFIIKVSHRLISYNYIRLVYKTFYLLIWIISRLFVLPDCGISPKFESDSIPGIVYQELDIMCFHSDRDCCINGSYSYIDRYKSISENVSECFEHIVLYFQHKKLMQLCLSSPT